MNHLDFPYPKFAKIFVAGPIFGRNWPLVLAKYLILLGHDFSSANVVTHKCK